MSMEWGDCCGSVCYGDINGVYAPLKDMYHSTESRCLVSPHPLSLDQEVATVFCPNLCSASPDTLLNFEVDKTWNCCTSCFECPVCMCTLTPLPIRPTEKDSPFCLTCPFCRWNSIEVSLIGPTVNDVITKAAAADEKDPTGGVFASRVSRATAIYNALHGKSRIGSVQTFQPEAPLANQSEQIDPASSIWINLETRLNAKAQLWDQESHTGLPMAMPLHKGLALSADVIEEHDCSEEPADTTLWSQTDANLLASTEQRYRCAGGPLQSMLYPRRVPLRARCVKRCIADMEAGRAGIMSKPQLNALVGDSSQRTNVGKWWKKECSAVHTIPRITVEPSAPPVIRQRSTEEGSNTSTEGIVPTDLLSLVLRIVNPVDTPVHVTLALDNKNTQNTQSSMDISITSSDNISSDLAEKDKKVLLSMLMDAAEDPLLTRSDRKIGFKGGDIHTRVASLPQSTEHPTNDKDNTSGSSLYEEGGVILHTQGASVWALVTVSVDQQQEASPEGKVTINLELTVKEEGAPKESLVCPVRIRIPHPAVPSPS